MVYKSLSRRVPLSVFLDDRRQKSRLACLLIACFGSGILGCATHEAAAPTPAAPVTTTAVSGGTLVVPANLPPEQQAQIRAQEQATLDYNRQHAMPPPAGK